ncbi:uncharacterized protein SAPINGB_P005096 [Magnusiomyces paraingens]|uniref:Serine/threonine-protein phosphatase n=1 Tax=Magnusiomyces paraingens TaxID=2606893 RepID=A0A5E8BYB6_9ASCO|nr:uncharacterized protein SAPINGB_P005096 [Saprochaete ingens]VVT56487.1 unnamed protein product [Saprochaete ingens]
MVSEEDKTKADALKVLGNKALQQNHYDEAIKLYTQAIELNPNNEIYYANRAQVNIKEESYGLAIEDATKAIEINPKYMKSYYRRGVALAAIFRHSEALKDFKIVVTNVPTDKHAQTNLTSCQKIIRAKAFARAIEVQDAPSTIESINLKSMAVEDSYDGLPLEIDFHGGKTESASTNGTSSEKMSESQALAKIRSLLSTFDVKVTKEFVADMLDRFKNGKLIHRKYLFAIVMQAMKHFINDPTLVELQVTNPLKKFTICGDTHGQFFDLMNIFEKNGYPSESHAYLFNGDFVDRGSWSTEIAILFYAYKCLYPNSFFLNRGNHEADDMNKMYGFEGECKAKYKSDNIFKLFSESFCLLPLATLINNSYLVLHGGLFSKDGVTLDDIRKIDRFGQKQPGNSGLMMEILWTDPQTAPGRSQSKRGVGIQFGPDVTENFCKQNKLKAIIRSHEVCMDGYEKVHDCPDGKLYTVFSAPNYCDSQGNKGAYINIEGPNHELDFTTFEAVPHPDVKPMAYANKFMF